VTLSNPATQMTLRDYWRVVWLRRGLVIAIVVAFTVLAFANEVRKPTVYTASARLMYAPPPTVSNGVVGDSTDVGRMSLEIQNVVSMITTPQVRLQAAKVADEKSAATASVSAIPVIPTDQTSATAVATVVDVTAEAGTAAAAAKTANAYAEAVIKVRKDSQQESWRAAQQIIQGQIDLYKTSESRQTGEYAVLMQQLRNLQIAEASANGDFQVVVPATPPSSRTSPKPLKWALFGFVAGLFFGVVAAFVVSQFDTRVRDREETQKLIGMPLIGHVGRLSAKSLANDPLFVLNAPNSVQAEAVRKLRANLEYTEVDGRLKSVFFTSATQHEGKSTLICNLAIALAEAGNRVALIDCDLRRPTVHQLFGLRNAVGVSSVLAGKTKLAEALRPVGAGGRSPDGAAADAPGGQPRLAVLTSGPLPPNPGEMVASASFAALVARLETEFDIVLVDAPALLAVGDTAAMARCVEGLVFVVSLTAARRPLLTAAASQLAQMPCRKLGLVTIGRDSTLGYGAQYSYYQHRDPNDATAPRVTVRG
jgi:Mrp family chromosome partitioning ATPase/capsular polysaccharide biosynthesis protein